MDKSKTLAIKFFIFCQLLSIAASAIIESSSVFPEVVRPGDNVTFYCKVSGGNIAFAEREGCLWNAPHPSPDITPRLTNPGSGIIPLDDGDKISTCNFMIEATDATQHHGPWVCNPVMEKGNNIPALSRIKVNLTIAVEPNPPKPFIFDSETVGRTLPSIEGDEGTIHDVVCGLNSTRPGPDFHWYLASPSGGLEIPLDENEEQGRWSIPDEGPRSREYKDLEHFFSNYTLRLDADMNSMKLRCYADHLMLDGGENFTDVSITVRGGPRMKQCFDLGNGHAQTIAPSFDCNQKAFRFSQGIRVVASVFFSSNPEPTSVQWIIPSLGGAPLAGKGSKGPFTSAWGKVNMDENLKQSMPYWDREDLYWANLTIDNYKAKYESDQYVLEVSNGLDISENTNDQGAAPPAQRSAQGQLVDRNDPNQPPSQQGQLVERNPSGISPRHDTSRRYTFTVASLPGRTEAAMSGAGVAGIVLGVVSLVVIVAVVIVSHQRGLLCFKRDHQISNYLTRYQDWRQSRSKGPTAARPTAHEAEPEPEGRRLERDDRDHHQSSDAEDVV